MKTNPRVKPCGEKQAEEMAEVSFITAVACGLSTIAEAERLTPEQMHKLWDDVNETALKIGKQQIRLQDITAELRYKYGIEGAQIVNIPVRTVRDAQRKARYAFRFSASLFLWELSKIGAFTAAELRTLWGKMLGKEDSIRQRFCTLKDVCGAVREEYGIHVLNEDGKEVCEE